MQACGNCGQPRIGGKKFCTRCGTRFPDEVVPETVHAPPTVSRSPYRTVAFVAAGIALLAGIGVGAWLIVAHSGSQTTAQNQQNPQTGGLITSPGGAGSPAAEGSPSAGGARAGVSPGGSARARRP